MPENEPLDPTCMWVISDVAPDGTYITTVQFAEDLSLGLSRESGLRYAAAMAAAAQRAQFDAAAYAQLVTGMSMPVKLALQSIGIIRGDRAPLDSAATTPVELRPGVGRAGNPFIGMWVAGTQIGQLTVAAAMEHAAAVLGALEAAALDNAYFEFLRTTAMSEEKSRSMISDLASWHRSEGCAIGDDPA